MSVGLSARGLAEAFPYHLVVDERLVVVQRGPSLGKVLPALVAGERLSDHLSMRRPEAPLSFATLAGAAGEPILLEARSSPLMLRGQVHVEDGRAVLLVSPRVTSAADLGRLGVSLSDFAAQDPAIDYLFLVHAQESALADAVRLADRLGVQRAALRATNRRLAAQYTITRVLADAPSLDGAIDEVLEALCHALDANTATCWRWNFANRTLSPRGGRALSTDGTNAPPDATLAAAVISSGEPQVAAPDGRLRTVAVPLVEGGSVAGVLEVRNLQTLAPLEDVQYLLDDAATKLAQAAVHRAATDELRRRDALLQAIAASAPVGLYAVQLAGPKPLYKNQRFRDLIGDDTCPAWPALVSHEQVVTSLRAEVEDPGALSCLALDAGGEVVVTEVALRADRVLRIHRAPIRGDNVPVGCLFMVDDVTAARRSEHELASRSAALETARGRLEAQAEQLRAQSADLEVARDAALESARLKSAFVANTSHELRTPLNAVLGIATLLGATPLDEDQRSMVGSLQRSGDVLLRLINDILDLSRIEAGKLEIEQVPFDLRTLVDDVMQQFHPSARARGLSISDLLDASVPDVLVGDPHRIWQVLSNLVGNAIKFTVRGEVTVRIRATPVTGERSTLRLEVTDTGIGMDEQQLARLFQPFTQADSSTTRRFGGTGLGLTICKHLMTLMGGDLTVVSRAGAGTTFVAEVPVMVSREAPVPLRPIRRRASDTEPAPARARRPSSSQDDAPRVLVVEDNLVNTEVVVRMLWQLGFGTDTVADGRAAVTAVRQRRYALVLMDCHMPGLDGLDATAEIRALTGPERCVPIVACTASAQPEDRARCRAVGMDDFLAKPIELAELERVVERWGSADLDAITERPMTRREIPEAPSISPSPPPDPVAALDDTTVARLRAMGTDRNGPVLAQIARLYLAQLPRRLVALRAHLAAGDAAAIGREAHGLKGMSDSVGAREVAQVCGRIEHDVRAGEAPDARLPALEAAVERAVAAITQLADGLRGF